MKPWMKLLIGAAVFALVLAGGVVLYQRLADRTPVGPEQEQQQTLTPAQNFTVEDANGRSVSLASKRGKPVVLNLWASWCPPCVGEMPEFEALYRELGDEIEFMMVNAVGGRETKTSAMAFIANGGYTLPVYFDTKSEVSRANISGYIPATWFINAAGETVHRVTGALTEQALRAGIERIR